jgi:integrase
MKMTELTYEAVFKLYFEEHAKQFCARPHEIDRAFELHFTPLRDKEVTSLTRLDIQKWVNKVAEESGRESAKKNFQQLKAVLRWGEAMDLYTLRKDPTIKITTPKSKPRRDYMKKEEFDRFVYALSLQSELIRDFFLVLFLTGARKSNVMSMQWEELDLSAGLWFVPDSKNGEPLTLVLSGRALAILQDRKSTSKSKYVFPSCGKTGHLVHIGKAWNRIKEIAGVQKLRPHDLRRTVGCWMALSGVSLQIIGETLGHKSYDSTLAYAHLHKVPVRDALEQIQSSLPDEIAPQESGREDSWEKLNRKSAVSVEQP